MESHVAMEVRILGPAETDVLARVAEGVFDYPVRRELCAEFLQDGRHHLAVAVEEGEVIGMASGVHYVHPDKEADLWINEVGVAEAHRGRGVGKALVRVLLEEGRRLGCREGWVLTDRGNAAAMRLYGSCGGKETPPDSVMFTFPLQ